MKIGLGTVQFGCNYGISNKNGQVSLEEIEKILNYAASVGIDTLDTASLYGTSEKMLGNFDLSKFKVVTKTVKVDTSLEKGENLKHFETAFHNSIENLKTKPYGLLFHEANDLIGEYGDDLWNLLLKFKNDGLVQKIGVSVYTPEQLLKISDKYQIDITQFPLNILDQRFVPIMKKLKEKNIEIHTRSTFLQGLLLMNPDEINPYFTEIIPLLKELPDERLRVALDFAKSLDEVDKIIVGTTKREELEQIVSAINCSCLNISYERYKIKDERFILPQNWRLS